jgi:hypothetical protein
MMARASAAPLSALTAFSCFAPPQMGTSGSGGAVVVQIRLRKAKRAPLSL